MALELTLNSGPTPLLGSPADFHLSQAGQLAAEGYHGLVDGDVGGSYAVGLRGPDRRGDLRAGALTHGSRGSLPTALPALCLVIGPASLEDASDHTEATLPQRPKSYASDARRCAGGPALGAGRHLWSACLPLTGGRRSLTGRYSGALTNRGLAHAGAARIGRPAVASHPTCEAPGAAHRQGSAAAAPTEDPYRPGPTPSSRWPGPAAATA